MSEVQPLRCGMVTIVGRPNVGKSTLLNKIVEEKVAIVSPVPQTTRNPVRGIYNDDRGQIVFIDTPGLHKGRDKLDAFMSRAAYAPTEDADCVIHLVDAMDPVGPEERTVVERLSALSCPVILGLNKVDAGDRNIPAYLQLWEEVKGRPVQELERFVILPLAAKTGMNVDKLVEIIYGFLPVGDPLYPRDAVTDVPQKMVIADIIREKLFLTMRHEIPHSVAVMVEDMEVESKGLVRISGLIIVERDSQKEIVIGKGGKMLKEIGTAARLELEDLLEAKVFLELFVKSRRHWRDDMELLGEMGYMDI